MNSENQLQTDFCRLVGIKYPIVQTGMGWVSGPRLTAATSTAGGLGILASATMRFSELESAIDEVRRRTDRPFGVNLRADQPDIGKRIDLLIAARVKLASFAQAPSKEVIHRLKDAGIVTMPTIGRTRHAEKVAAWGVDAIIAQGHEGGGHTGPIPTSLLLPQVCRAVDVPVLGAGGFFDGRGLVAALAYGAQGIALGTRFLLTEESTVPDAVKAQYLATDDRGTVVTSAVDGYPQRVIRTKLIDALESASGLTRFPRAAVRAFQLMRRLDASVADLVREGFAMKRNRELTWSQVALAANAPMLTKAALVDGRTDVGILPTGQVVGVIDALPTVAEVVEGIVCEAHEALNRLNRLGEPRSQGDHLDECTRGREYRPL